MRKRAAYAYHPGELPGNWELELAFYRCWSPGPVTLPEFALWRGALLRQILYQRIMLACSL